MKALSNRSAMFFMFVIYMMALSMKCMLSFNNYHPNMEQQEHINVRKFQIKQKKKPKENQKNKIIGWFFFFPHHQLTVNRTQDDPCSALLGYFLTKKDDWRRLRKHNKHQKEKKKNRFFGFTSSQDFRTIKTWNQWKDTFNWSLMSHKWYVCHLNVLR